MRIVLLRKRLKLTQEGFAARLDVSLRTLLRWEGGYTKPSRLAVRRLEGLEGLEGLDKQ